MKKAIWVVLFIGLTTLSVYAQTEKWLSLVNTGSIQSIVAVGDYIYFTSSPGGLNQYNIQTKKMIHLYKTSSGKYFGNEVSNVVLGKENAVYFAPRYHNGDSYHACLMKITGDSIQQVYDLPSDYIGLRIFYDSKGNIWFASGSYGAKLSPSNQLTYFPMTGCSDFVEDKKGEIWITTYGGQLYRYDDTLHSFTRISLSNSYYFQGITVDTHNNIWAAYYNSSNNQLLGKYDGSSWQYFQSNLPGEISKILADSDGNLWVSGIQCNLKEYYLTKFDGNTWATTYYDDTLNFARNPISSSNSKVYFGTNSNFRFEGYFVDSPGKIYVYENNNFIDQYNVKFGTIPAWNISAIKEDPSGNIWLDAIIAGGISKFNYNGWEVFEPGSDNYFEHVNRGFGFDNEGNIWMGGGSSWASGCNSLSSKGGLVRMGKGTMNYWNSTNGLTEIINDVAVFNNTVCAIGFASIYIYNGGTFSTYDTTNSNLPKLEKNIFFDKDGNLWSGNYRTSDFIHWQNMGLIDDGAFGVLQQKTCIDYNGNIWFPRNGYLVKWKNISIDSIKLPNFSIKHFAVGKEGQVVLSGGDWVIGVYYYDGTSWTKFTPANSPMSYDRFDLVFIDSRGSVWITTSQPNHVLVFNPKGIPSSIKGTKLPDIPNQYVLYQNYPNPFNGSTVISFDTFIDANVNLAIYNILGQKIQTLVNNSMNRGHHSINWGPKNLSSDIYFYQLRVNGVTITKKINYLK